MGKVNSKIIIGTTAVMCALLIKPVVSFANVGINKFELSESQIVYEAKESKGKILIYHSHSQEEYIDSDVIEMGRDLSAKLQKKGYTVEHIEIDFSGNDYNNSYNASRRFLQGLNLDDYDLVVDFHRDALTTSNTVLMDSGEVAKGMLVYSQSSKYYSDSLKIGNKIINNLDKFDDEISRDNWIYESGLLDFNSDLNDNIILLESGNNSNNKLEIKRLNTYLASAIDTYLEQNK